MQRHHSTSATPSAIWTIPNLLSCFRLLLIPAIVHTALHKNDPLLTAGLTVLSGVTDLADGYIARRFHMVSDLGKALDPIADKLTQIAVMGCLAVQYPLMLIPLGLLVLKEIAAAVMGLLVIHRTGQVYGADWHGKASTALLYGMMTLHLLRPNLPTMASSLSILLCTVMILFSCIRYTMKNLQLMRGCKTN